MRFAKYKADQEEQLINAIDNLRRGALPTDYEASSLSDQLTGWQEANGFVDPSEREGLSVGQKNLLHRAGMQAATDGGWPAGTVLGGDGIYYQPGAVKGTWIPAQPNLLDHEDFAAAEKEAKAYDKAAEKIWPQYRVLYPNDDPADIEAAMRVLTASSGMLVKDINAIAEDTDARRTALHRLHQTTEQIAYERAYGSHYGQQAASGDDDRTGGLFGGGGGGGYSSGGGSSNEQQLKQGSVSAEVRAWQKRMGLIHE